MKKIIIFLLIIIAILCLISCGSRPINPKIIGTTYLLEEKGTIFAELDSARYIPQFVITGKRDKNPNARLTSKPAKGMQVTIFTSDIHRTPVFFAGEATIEQIEEYYHKDFSVFTSIGGFVLALLAMIVIHRVTKRKPIEIDVVHAKD